MAVGFRYRLPALLQRVPVPQIDQPMSGAGSALKCSTLRMSQALHQHHRGRPGQTSDIERAILSALRSYGRRPGGERMKSDMNVREKMGRESVCAKVIRSQYRE